MKKQVFYFLSIILIISGCNKSINNFKKDNVSFSSLPVEVKDFFYNVRDASLKERHEFFEFIHKSGNVPSTEIHEYRLPNLFTFNTTHEYEFKIVGTLIGPASWVSHCLLIDKTNNISYRIAYNTPTPVIVFDKKIFIPQVYNLFTVYKDKFETLNFDCYSLDKK